MSGWLTAAKNVLRGAQEAPPQTFEIVCSCGKRISGQRASQPQRAKCPKCQSALFVFPASVYPLPRLAPKKPAEPSASGPIDASRGELPTGNATRGQRGRTNRTPGSAAPRGTAVTVPASETIVGRLRTSLEPENLNRLRRKVFTPVRVVLLGVVVVIGATGWWIGHLRALDRARDVLSNVPSQAEELLAEGDLAEAAKKFAELSRAVDVLGRDDSQARRWRQTGRETAALSDLASSPLHEIVRDAAEADAGPDGATWADFFRINFRDGWVVIDAPVSRTTEPSSGRRYKVDFPLTVGDHRGTLVADFPGFERVVPADGTPKRVIFAGQLAECRPSSDDESVWQITLRPDTGFLWSTADAYRLAGLFADEESLAVLAAQSRLLGVEP